MILDFRLPILDCRSGEKKSANNFQSEVWDLCPVI